MKEKINVGDYAKCITESLAKGVLLNTNGDKFNTMVIGWGALGRVWGLPAFTVYVRDSRYTKAQLDKTGEFTVSIPLDGPVPKINQVCGFQSGRDIDKVKEAGLTLEEAEVIHTPGIREYPLTLECRLLYAQRQDLSVLPKEIVDRLYPPMEGRSDSLSDRDVHTGYIGRIVAAYIIR